MQFGVGTLVVVRATGERGVVVRRLAVGMAEVAFPDGVRLTHLADLDPAPQEPDRLLLDGALGPAEAYSLRLQALYLQHAYRFDPLSGLSNARIEPRFHQVFVAWRVNRKLAPRMILADGEDDRGGSDNQGAAGPRARNSSLGGVSLESSTSVATRVEDEVQ